jgi:hypothetical protein
VLISRTSALVTCGGQRGRWQIQRSGGTRGSSGDIVLISRTSALVSWANNTAGDRFNAVEERAASNWAGPVRVCFRIGERSSEERPGGRPVRDVRHESWFPQSSGSRGVGDRYHVPRNSFPVCRQPSGPAATAARAAAQPPAHAKGILSLSLTR